MKYAISYINPLQDHFVQCNWCPPHTGLYCVYTPHHVPKGVRDGWAQIVGDALSAVVSSPSDVSVWCKLFMLARCILISPPRGGRSHWRATLKLVRSRIQKWKKEDLLTCGQKLLPRTGSSGQRTLLPSLFVVQMPAVLVRLWRMGSNSPRVVLLKLPVPPPVQVAEVNVIKALRSFPSSTAAGPSGLRANHLKEAVLPFPRQI